MKSELSIIIITKNAQHTIADCLLSCRFASEIILCHNSTDDTVKISQTIVPSIKIFPNPQPFVFSTARNEALRHATKKWVLFIDDDERITPKLKSQIIKSINSKDNITNYDIPRANYFLGKRVKYGGTYPDYVKRLFLVSSFQGYSGNLHEQPIISGPQAKLTGHFNHYTHTDLSSMLTKSIDWTPLEARLLFEANHPPVVWWRFIRMMFTKLWQRLIIQSMWRDGIVGWISVIFEVFDTYMIYASLYEYQQSHAQGRHL